MCRNIEIATVRSRRRSRDDGNHRYIAPVLCCVRAKFQNSRCIPPGDNWGINPCYLGSPEAIRVATALSDLSMLRLLSAAFGPFSTVLAPRPARQLLGLQRT